MSHKILHQWKALEYNLSKKSAAWGISIVIVSIIFVIIGILKYDITIIALAILGGFTILHFGRKKPKNIISRLEAMAYKLIINCVNIKT